MYTMKNQNILFFLNGLYLLFLLITGFVFQVSHAAIKGTARPTRYHSVCNDGGIPHDEVEQLTFYLCHLYSRCMR